MASQEGDGDSTSAEQREEEQDPGLAESGQPAPDAAPEDADCPAGEGYGATSSLLSCNHVARWPNFLG